MSSGGGFSRTESLVVCCSIVLFSVALVIGFDYGAKRSLAPFQRLDRGLAAHEVRELVGEPEFETRDLETVKDHSSVPSFACQELGATLPTLKEPLLPESGVEYGPAAARPLPPVSGAVLVYFPFLFEVLVYLDEARTVESVLYCHT